MDFESHKIGGIKMNSRAFEVIKEDWENVKKRWEAWWDCDYFDRAIVQVTAPKNKPNWWNNDPLLRRVFTSVFYYA